MRKSFTYCLGHMAFVRLVCMLLCVVAIACGCKNTDTSDLEALPDSTTPDYVEKIRAARAKLAPMEKSLLPKITEQYNLDVSGHAVWAKNCLAYRKEFGKIEELTLYPQAFIAGIAMHESAGCNMSARDWAGGRGLMQITSPPSKREKTDAARLLGIKVSDLDWKGNALHNIVVGVIRLDRFERLFQSRFHGILAYNTGPGGVRRAARADGWARGETLPSIFDLKPHLRYDRRMKPRAYVQQIVASTVMMDRALNGEQLRRAKSTLRPGDVPGWYPAYDGRDR